MVGLCGGHTIFSSFSLQLLDLMRERAIVRAAPSTSSSQRPLRICAIIVGHLIAKHLNGVAAQIAQIAVEEEG